MSIVLFLLAVIIDVGYAKDSAVIRKVHWNMSIMEVLSAEAPRQPIHGAHEERLIYQENLFGQPALLTYTFEKKRLVSAVYSLLPSEDFSYSESFFQVVLQSLKTKYGQPKVNAPIYKKVYPRVYTFYSFKKKTVVRLIVDYDRDYTEETGSRRLAMRIEYTYHPFLKKSGKPLSKQEELRREARQKL